MAITIARISADGAAADPGPATNSPRRLDRRTTFGILMSAATAVSGLATIVVVGTWLEDSFGISTGGVGFTAMAFGCAELLASGSSARFSDQLLNSPSDHRQKAIFQVMATPG